MTTTQAILTTLPKASYAKLRDGSWGLNVTTSRTPLPGAVIIVTKRDGTTKSEYIGQILWSGEGRFLCTIERNDAPRSASRSGFGRGAGSAANVAGYSAYCTDRPGCGCFDCAS